MSFLKSIAVALGLMAAPMAPANKPPSPPPSDYVVHLAQTPDEKAVFATIETANVVPARVRAEDDAADGRDQQDDRRDLEGEQGVGEEHVSYTHPPAHATQRNIACRLPV